jgi:WD40 repeat protein
VPEKGTTRKKVRLNEYTAIDAAKLEELIGYFIDNKILTGCSEHIYELAHESLVPVIQQVKLNEIRARLTVPTILRDPYKGLSSFTEGDKNMFFGRKEAVKMVYEKITQHDLVVIVGNSGTGKSSLIKAGVWPLLEKDGYTVMDPIRAGERPVAFLGSRLEEVACDKENNKFLLLIDQYEELTTRIGQEEIRDTVARKLYEALEKQRTGASPCKIKFVITIRADFEPQFRIIKPLDDYWNAGKYFVPPFTREEIREVIEEPAYQAGLEFSPPSLVEEIMEEVYSSQSTGMLPLMSFTLKELYDRYVKSGRNDNLLREEDYQQLGGVIGGLQNRAKQVYEAFKEEYPESYDRYRNMMRNIILRMIYLSTGELAGQRAQAEDLIYINDETNEIKQNILDKLIESHLVVTGIDCADKVYYEPAHDVLVRSWGQIWDWIREVGDVKLSSRRRLTQAVNDYINSNKDEKLLWDNKWLDELEPEVKDENTWLNKKEFDFVTPTLQKREAAAALIRSYEEEKDRQQQERDAYQKNKIKRTRTFSVITLILLSIALVMFGWAMKNGQAAKKSQLLAEKSREAAVKRREEAVYNYKVAMQINERNKQLMLSLQDKNGILAAQRDSVDAARKLAELAAAKEKAERKKADQLVKERDSEIAIRKKTEDDLKQRTDDLQQRTNALNAKVAYADSINRELKAAFLALQLQRSQNVTQLTGISKSLEKNDLVKAYRVAQLAFAKDSSNREVAEQYGKLANKPAYYYTREMEGDYAAISPSGEYLLATSSRDQMLRLRHMGTYQLIDSVAVPGLLSAVFSSSSRSLLLTYNNKVEIRRVSNLRDKNNFRINERNIVAAAMAPDESRLLLVADGQLQVRRVLFNGEMPVREYTVRTGEKIVSAVFSDDSKHIISGSLNGNIRLWDASSGKAIEQSTVKNITSSYISPKGNCFIISTPTELYIYNGYGERIKVIDQGNYGKFSKALFSNDGQQVLLSFNATYAKFQMNEQQVIKGDYNSNKNAAILLNIKTARILHVTEFIPGEDLSGLTATVGAMPVILNGNQLLYGLDHGTIKLITLTNGNREILAGYNVPVTSLFMNAAPELIVTGAENNVIRIWQYNTARRLDLQGVLPKLSNEELAKLGIKN